jgi:hypothetical protein
MIGLVHGRAALYVTSVDPEVITGFRVNLHADRPEGVFGMESLSEQASLRFRVYAAKPYSFILQGINAGIVRSHESSSFLSRFDHGCSIIAQRRYPIRGKMSSHWGLFLFLKQEIPCWKRI